MKSILTNYINQLTSIRRYQEWQNEKINLDITPGYNNFILMT
jgi:hypothetical protein